MKKLPQLTDFSITHFELNLKSDLFGVRGAGTLGETIS